MARRHLMLGLLLIGLGAVCFDAQSGDAPEVFTIIQLDPPPSPPGGRYLQTFSVSLDMEALKQPAQLMTLNLPGREPEVVQLEHWEPRRGYIQIPDPADPSGQTSITIPDPNASPADFAWRWYGRSGRYTLALTTVDGVVAGRITSADFRYAVEPTGDGPIRLGFVNSAFWQTHPGDNSMVEGNAPTSLVAFGTPALSMAPRLEPFATYQSPTPLGSGWDPSCSDPLPVDIQVIDVLLLYTTGLLNRYAGNTSAVHAVLLTALDDANQAIRNSGISGVTFSPRGPEFLPHSTSPPLNYDSAFIDDALYRVAGVVRHLGSPFYTFPGNAYVAGRRDDMWADIVAVGRADLSGEGTCGVSFANRYVVNNDYPTQPGPDFDKFAYLVFDPTCNADRLNLAHELGHQMGVEHDPSNYAPHFAPGIDPSCPWSFGHKHSLGDPRFRFRTVMSYWQNVSGGPGGPSSCGSDTGCPQIDAFSTPLLEWAGIPASGGAPPFGLQPLGTVGGALPIGVAVQTPSQKRADGADTIKRIAPIVEDYRDRPNVIFANGFE